MCSRNVSVCPESVADIYFLNLWQKSVTLRHKSHSVLNLWQKSICGRNLHHCLLGLRHKSAPVSWICDINLSPCPKSGGNLSRPASVAEMCHCVQNLWQKSVSSTIGRNLCHCVANVWQKSGSPCHLWEISVFWIYDRHPSLCPESLVAICVTVSRASIQHKDVILSVYEIPLWR